MKLYRLRDGLLGLSIAGVAFVGLSSAASATETKSFVVSWFTQAMNSQEGDCPAGTNPTIEEQWRKDLLDIGKTPDEAEDLIKQVKLNTFASEPMKVLMTRGRVDGKPVNAYANPQSVKDPHLVTAAGKYAFGFNLDGKGAASPASFEDPETHELGVNNQLARALGCLHSFRATPPTRSSNWELWWGVIRESTPAWLVTIAGDDLSKDGDVTVTLDRALEHTSKDVNSETRADMTFRIDPGPQSHNVLHAKIKNGIIVTDQPTNVHLVGDLLVLPEFVMHQTHMRLKLMPDGKLDGIIGGYQPWNDIYYGLGFGGYAVESMLGADIPGMYHLFRQLADADPDPKTGLNRSISAAWHIEAVPAFAVPVDDGKKQKTAAR